MAKQGGGGAVGGAVGGRVKRSKCIVNNRFRERERGKAMSRILTDEMKRLVEEKYNRIELAAAVLIFHQSATGKIKNDSYWSESRQNYQISYKNVNWNVTAEPQAVKAAYLMLFDMLQGAGDIPAVPVVKTGPGGDYVQAWPQKKMKLYLISQDVNNDWDTYNSLVVAAKNEEEARNTNPVGRVEWPYRNWCAPEQVKVQLIGEAVDGIEKGVICASFTAG